MSEPHDTAVPNHQLQIDPFHLAVYSDAGELGGAEMNLAVLLGGLPKQVRVTLVCVDHEVASWLAGHRPNTATVVLNRIEDRSQIGQMWAHRRAFVALDADVIHFNLSMGSSCQWPMLVATTVHGPKRIAIENSSMGVWSSLSRRLKKFTAPRLAAHIAVGDATARALEHQSDLKANSIQTIYHGIPDVAQDVAHDGDGLVICNIGRHDSVKGIDVLIEAMAKVDEPVRLVQIGTGPLLETHKQLAKDLGVEHRVEFRQLGWEDRVADALGAFDAFVLSSRLEGLPVSIMEAMLAGLAVIATDVGAVSEEVADGESGRLVAPEDPDGLAAAINDVMADTAQREQFGRRGREIALDRFTLEPMIERYLTMYRRVLSGEPRPIGSAES